MLTRLILILISIRIVANLQERVAQEAALSAEIQSLQSALSDQEAARQVEVSGLEHQVKKRHQYLENFSQVCYIRIGGGGRKEGGRVGFDGV